MVPILIDVYGAGMITRVHIKTWNGFSKTISFLHAEEAQNSLTLNALTVRELSPYFRC